MTQALLQLILLFGGLSMLAFGGGSGVLPDMQRAVVDHYHWLTAKEFLDMFAISRAQPGPGSLIVVLVGLKVAGLAGALVSFVAMFAPPSLVVFLVARGWHRAAASAWRQLVEQALAPVAVGLTFASGLALMRQTEHGWVAWGVTAVSTLLFSFTEINPLLLLAGGAAALLLAASAGVGV
ncbi:MAG TPA: chromate transporter [Rhodopila sp.]|uniref:chromate transporter n=1 Tax=Rhodopila sp. TaxID=2480087 RepID=UPI002C1F1213|nr:chromate transporter [Rhodopila sp.]HVY16944.1 chromate transporter [Rhodopila sp.]